MIRPNTSSVQQAVEVLQDIAVVLQGTSGQQLWAILTALRGPDNESDSLKACTTAVIRRIALGSAPAYVGAISLPDNTERTMNRIRYLNDTHAECPWHFREHARTAMDALNELGLYPPSREED